MRNSSKIDPQSHWCRAENDDEIAVQGKMKQHKIMISVFRAQTSDVGRSR